LQPATEITLEQVLGAGWTEVEPGVYVLVEATTQPRLLASPSFAAAPAPRDR
jgi:hypothetical protein